MRCTARIAEAGGKAFDQTDRPVRRAEQQRAGIRRDRPAVKRRHHPTPFNTGESRTNPGYTLSASGTSSASAKSLLQNNFR